MHAARGWQLCSAGLKAERLGFRFETGVPCSAPVSFDRYTAQLYSDMQLFFHDVGLQGSNRDFPKTVFANVPVQVVEERTPGFLKEEVVAALREKFPRGSFNVWGVPAGAQSVIKRLECVMNLQTQQRSQRA